MHLKPSYLVSETVDKYCLKVGDKSRIRLLSALTLSAFLVACSNLETPDKIPPADASVNIPPKNMQVQRAQRARLARENAVKNAIVPIEYDDVWTRLADGLQFSFDIDNERVEAEIAKYLEDPAYFRIVSERAEPFLFEIIEILEQRGLPMELALLPFIESAYNPNAAAPPDTVGLWQIMGSTGEYLGLKQDWWYDGRRDPIASTNAALDYLEQLYLQFDEDWPLALAAYNTGPGNVQRAINRAQRNSKPQDYWSLRLPRITAAYVPKLIALSHIISERDTYAIELADVANQPFLHSVEIGSQIDLALAAELAGLDAETLYQLNPGYRQWATHPDSPNHLLLPIDRVDTFTVALNSLDQEDRVTWDRYLVRSGDTLGGIASRFNTQVSALQRANKISGSRIIAGESLLIPRAYTGDDSLQSPNAPLYSSDNSAAAALSRPTRYTVRSGDSLWKIAQRFDLTIADLTQWNRLEATTVLRIGQELHLLSDPTLAQAETNIESEQDTFYEVLQGDTLGRIARRLDLSIEDLVRWNGISTSELIHPGQQLLILPSVN